MPIVSECGRRGGGGGGGSGSSSFGRRGKCCAAAASGGSSLSSARRGSDSSRALGVMQCGEMENDEEVQSSYKGPFYTMDALQDALPNKRKGGFKFYNGKTNTVVDAAQPAKGKGIANPVNPSPKKRKGFLPFSFSWTKPWSKGSRSRRGATSSSKNFRNSAEGNSRGDGNEHQADSQDPACHCLSLHRRPNTPAVSASPPGAGALRAQRISVQMRSVSVAGVEDVSESTASVQKRRKSLQY